MLHISQNFNRFWWWKTEDWTGLVLSVYTYFRWVLRSKNSVHIYGQALTERSIHTCRTSHITLTISSVYERSYNLHKLKVVCFLIVPALASPLVNTHNNPNTHEGVKIYRSYQRGLIQKNTSDRYLLMIII